MIRTLIIDPSRIRVPFRERTGGRQTFFLPKKLSRTTPTYRTARCYISIRVLDLGDVHENGIPWFGQEVLPMNGVFAQTVPLLCRIDRYHEHSNRRYTATMEIMCMTMRTNTYNHPPARSGNYSKSPRKRTWSSCFLPCSCIFLCPFTLVAHIHQSTLRVSEQ
jgi:hypothetical protein